MSDDPSAYRAVPGSRRRWDLGSSITLLVFAGVLVGLSAVVGLFSLAFLDSCPPATCSTTAATGAVLGGVVLMGACAVAGLVVVVGRLRRHRTAWPVALATVAATVLVLVATAAGYATAVDH